MPARLIVLAGAPHSDALSWDDADSNASFTAPFKRFLREAASPPAPRNGTASQPTQHQAKWRLLEFKRPQLEMPGAQDASTPASLAASFYGNLAMQSPLDREAFLEHSLAVLEDLLSSQIADPNNGHDLDTTDQHNNTDSFATHDSNTDLSCKPPLLSSASPGQAQPTLTLTFPGSITDLSALPSAQHLRRIHPQTMTVDLLVGLIAAQPARPVQLRRPRFRRDGSEMSLDIVELLCGDETRAGFGITFWLTTPHSAASAAGHDVQQEQQPDSTAHALRRQLDALRTGDVLLLRNVALHEFRNAVYGQSLSRRLHRSGTVVEVLPARCRAVAGVGASGGVVAGKLERVRGWTAEFVGSGDRWRRGREHEGPFEDDRGGGKRARLQGEELPPDSPPG